MDAKEPTCGFVIRDFIIYKTFQAYAHYKPGPNELSVCKSILELDSFSNRCFVKVFCESQEGQFILSRPVEEMPQQCFNFGCDLDFGESFAIYLPTLALLYNSSLLMKRVLEQNFQCIHTTDFLKSTLIIASQLCLKDVLELLVQRGVIVDEDAIFLASAKTNNDSLEYLLQNFTGDCTECPHSTNKNSPLTAAAKNDNREAVDCIKTLIRHGCNVNYRNKNGWSALDKAVMYAAPESCKILLDNKANVNNKSAKFKRTLLHINADVGNATITSILLEHGLVVNIKDYRGHYPVQCAAFSDNVDIVDILLKADTSKVTQKHRVSYGKSSRIKGGSLYHIAVLNQSVKLIECLLQNNVCPNVRDFYGRTPLYVAVYGFEKKNKTRILNTLYTLYFENKQYDVIKKLSEHSDAHIADHNGYTPLHAAVHKGKIEVVKLLAPLCDVNARDKYGKTPLHTACDKVDFEIFKVLVEDYRADYHMRTKAGHSIFDILARKTEWRNIRRRYQNDQLVTKYMVEYPRLRSFKEVLEMKDHTFLEEVTKAIVLSGHPKDRLFTLFIEHGIDPNEYLNRLFKRAK
jgi:ankyrin repeat protein